MSRDLFRTEVLDMLSSSRHLPQRRERGKTFLEIGGYPHFENVASNILEFYFQSSNIHGYRDLLFRAMVSFFNIDISSELTVTARREEITSGNKRIDLVIEIDDIVIGIENKIYHELNNDLRIYWSHLTSIAGERKVYGVVLSLQTIHLPLDEEKFINITYTDFLEQVDLLLPESLEITNQWC